jgi:hypothetical protein
VSLRPRFRYAGAGGADEDDPGRRDHSPTRERSGSFGGHTGSSLDQGRAMSLQLKVVPAPGRSLSLVESSARGRFQSSLGEFLLQRENNDSGEFLFCKVQTMLCSCVRNNLENHFVIAAQPGDHLNLSHYIHNRYTSRGDFFSSRVTTTWTPDSCL